MTSLAIFSSSVAPLPALALIGSFSIWHWLIVLAVVVLLFGGKGKVSSIMKDVGIGVNQFRKGLKDGGSEESEQARIESDSPSDKDNG